MYVQNVLFSVETLSEFREGMWRWDYDHPVDMCMYFVEFYFLQKYRFKYFCNLCDKDKNTIK